VLFNQSFFFEKQRKRTHHDTHDIQNEMIQSHDYRAGPCRLQAVDNYVTPSYHFPLP
jgi:hypothetical protein